MRPDDDMPQPLDGGLLPLPVRGTRYVVGAILISIIVTVVVTTYLRIEQQLQATIEGKLIAVLNDHAHTAVQWIEQRQRLTEDVARLEGVVEAARRAVPPEGDEQLAQGILRDTISTLKRTDFIYEAYLLSLDGASVLAREARGPQPTKLERDIVSSLRKGQRRVLITPGDAQRRVVTFAQVVDGTGPLAVLALSLPPDSMARGLHSAVSSREKTYAFDTEGPLGGPASPPEDANADTVPPGALPIARGQAENNGDQHVEAYLSGDGQRVIGAWTWFSDYGFGVVTEVPTEIAHSSINLLRQSFLILVTLVGAALLGFIALGRWTLRVREESLLMTRRLTRLARAIQPLSAALEHDPSAVLLVDHEGTVVYANASSHRVLGVSAPLLGRDVDAVFEGLHTELQAALASGRDLIATKGNDSMDETLLVSSRSLSIDGAPHHLYMLRPITQQVRRQEVEHWKKLIRVLSHELNNALAPITSLLSSARKVNQMTHRDERLGRIFESISERTTYLISFLEGYREVARLPRPAPREVDWQLFLQSLGSQKKFRHVGDLPKSPGFFDPMQLERVVTNVINNAHEAGSPEDEVEVEIVEEAEGFRINIRDRGSGMPEAVLKQAMLPFFSTKRTGTGVGLALSREIIEAHGGQLTLANRDGGGLTVSCFLPNPATPPSRTSLGKVAITGDVVFRPSTVPPSSERALASQSLAEFSAELLRRNTDTDERQEEANETTPRIPRAPGHE